MPEPDPAAPDSLPLSGLKVLEFTHMIMGPACGLVLADLGADVIKIEPVPAGDLTRSLPGAGAGFFHLFNRNKRSLAVDLKAPAGRELVLRLCDGADVVFDNFAPGTMERLGFGWDALSARNPRLIQCTLKGFLAGPYERRAALDEVVQMMGGLAYMTGPPGRPLRAGASVVDILGGNFAALAILAAVEQRHRTGRGQLVKASLFETCALLVGQHMAQFAVTGLPAAPMPARSHSWPIYDVFETADGTQVFLGIVTDNHWHQFCAEFDRPDWRADPHLATNGDRVRQRERLLLAVRTLVAGLTAAELAARCERAALPFAPVGRPEDLFNDPHLNTAGGLLPVTLPDGTLTKLPALPVELDGHRPGLRLPVPRPGEHSRAVLADLGLDAANTEALIAQGIVVAAGG